MSEFLLWFCVFYVWHILGITIGYHRLLAHRAFRCPKPVEYFFVLGGYLAFESSPIWWATVHRAHHRYVDTPLDPHSPRYGNYQAYAGWVLHKHYPDHINPQLQAPDLINDPFYNFLERCNNWHRSHLTNSAIGFGSRLVLWLFFGWQIALASVLAGLFCQQVPFLLNVVCHKRNLGYKNFEEGDDSVNVWWLGILTMGENWHNNHHAFPGCARSGFRWFELDVSWMVIRMLERLHLASHVNARFMLESNTPADAAADSNSKPIAVQKPAASQKPTSNQKPISIQMPVSVQLPVSVQRPVPIPVPVMQTLRQADESGIR